MSIRSREKGHLFYRFLYDAAVCEIGRCASMMSISFRADKSVVAEKIVCFRSSVLGVLAVWLEMRQRQEKGFYF